jgi:arabinan endo-1,5-alpha-L-arabinosidase
MPFAHFLESCVSVPLLGVATVSLAAPAQAATSGANGTHDPSRMIESEGKLYIFSTGGSGKSSPDGLVWTNGDRLFPSGFPQWVGDLLSDTQGVWAPDVIYLNDQYYVYYSVAARSTKACAIGLITSPTLNPSSANYKWTDRGLVVANAASDTYCSIDPAPILDNDNKLWVVWGGGYTNASTAQSIWLTRVDNVTGLPSSADTAKPGHPLELGHKEGAYLHFHSGFYYLFWQTGGCCSGAASTYAVTMARSQSITGPFSGDRGFYKSHDSVHGPGHMGIYHACGVERFTYHYYPDTGGSVLGENELTWGNDGWPVAGPESTTPIKPCGEMANGTDGGIAGTGGSGGTGGSADQGSAGKTGGGDGFDSGGAPEVEGVGGGGPTGQGGTSLLGSGGLSKGGASIGGSDPGAASGEPSDAGCACSLPGNQGRSGHAQLLLVAAGVVLARARRRR